MYTTATEIQKQRRDVIDHIDKICKKLYPSINTTKYYWHHICTRIFRATIECGFRVYDESDDRLYPKEILQDIEVYKQIMNALTPYFLSLARNGWIVYILNVEKEVRDDCAFLIQPTPDQKKDRNDLKFMYGDEIAQGIYTEYTFFTNASIDRATTNTLEELRGVMKF